MEVVNIVKHEKASCNEKEYHNLSSSFINTYVSLTYLTLVAIVLFWYFGFTITFIH